MRYPLETDPEKARRLLTLASQLRREAQKEIVYSRLLQTVGEEKAEIRVIVYYEQDTAVEFIAEVTSFRRIECTGKPPKHPKLQAEYPEEVPPEWRCPKCGGYVMTCGHDPED